MCRRAVAAVLEASGAAPGAGAVEISVVLGDDGLTRRLNRDFRGRPEATNVLSFPAADPAAIGAAGAAPDALPLALGDVIVALETVLSEAVAQAKPLGDHLSHLIVHGVLHLLGHDHAVEAQAEIMEELEIRVLAELGVPDPYAPRPLGLN